MELSELSEEIAEWVNLMVEQFGAEIHVQHVIPDLNFWGVPYAAPPSTLDDQGRLIEKAEKELTKYCNRCLKPDLSPRIHVTIGNPAEEIINCIHTEAIDMVIVGTHGRSGLDRSIFGSVADRVLRFSPVPVLCINPHPKELKSS
jgi:nucleotide-binding universal stress UspA family protein